MHTFRETVHNTLEGLEFISEISKFYQDLLGVFAWSGRDWYETRRLRPISIRKTDKWMGVAVLIRVFPKIRSTKSLSVKNSDDDVVLDEYLEVRNLHASRLPSH